MITQISKKLFSVSFPLAIAEEQGPVCQHVLNILSSIVNLADVVVQRLVVVPFILLNLLSVVVVVRVSE